MGVVMVFSLVSAVQEKVGELLDNEVTAAAEQAEQEAKQKEEVGIAGIETHTISIHSLITYCIVALYLKLKISQNVP